jgi:hypothetical protein
MNTDINALDITNGVDAFRGFAYLFSGPCPCPSTVKCGATSCSSHSQCAAFGPGSLCVKTCTGGANDGQPCNNDRHCNYCVGGQDRGLPCDPAMLSACPGGVCSADGACGAGFCRDRCGRCN